MTKNNKDLALKIMNTREGHQQTAGQVLQEYFNKSEEPLAQEARQRGMITRVCPRGSNSRGVSNRACCIRRREEPYINPQCATAFQKLRNSPISHKKNRPLENAPEDGRLYNSPSRVYFTSSLRQVPSLMRTTFTPATGVLI